MDGDNLKILHVIPYYSEKMGGEYSACKALVESQTKAGHIVTVLTSDWPLQKSENDDKIVRLKKRFRLSNFIYTPSIKRWLLANCVDFDIVHLHTFRSYQNTAVCKLKKRLNVPIVVQPHGSATTEIGSRKLKLIFDVFFLPRMKQCADLVFALSESEKCVLTQMGFPEKKITIIPNGINNIMDIQYRCENEFRNRLRVNSDCPLLLFVGRIEPIKGIDILICAFSKVAVEHQEMTLAIVGPGGDYQNELERMVDRLGMTNRVIFTGPLYDRDKICAYDECDVVIIPSRYEMFPMVLLEALSLGKPVILSEECAVADEFRDYCLIIPPDETAIARAINVVFRNLDDYQARAQNNKEIIKDKYDIDNLTETILNHYRSIRGH